MQKITLGLFFLFFLPYLWATPTYPQYKTGTQYIGNEIVVNNGQTYQCTAGITTDWCGSVAWAYAPGSGTAWKDAWTIYNTNNAPTAPDETDGTGGTGGTSNKTYPQYKAGTKYVENEIVVNNGKTYQCMPGITVAWCGSVAWAYAPGSGTAWENAWSIYDANAPTGGSTGGSTNSNTQTFTAQQISDKEALLTSSPQIKATKDSIKTRNNLLVNNISPGAATNPENVKRVEGIISADTWDYLFIRRTPEYTYRNLLQATGKFPAFCATYTDGRDSDSICRKSLATMFAHFTQETGGHNRHDSVPEWRQGLVHVREGGWTESSRNGYNSQCDPLIWQGKTWPCGKFSDGEFKSYFGRGAKQLSYNYNYGPFSEAMFGTVRTLLDNPEQVADTWLNLASAVFFFVYPQPPKPSMLHVIDGTWVPNDKDISNNLSNGFGVTTQIINGGVECGRGRELAQSTNRIKYYKAFSNYLNIKVPQDEVLGCANMEKFDNAGAAGVVNIYWDKNWSYDGANLNGGSYACKLVAYQTPYSALKTDDYAKCVKNHFPDVVITD